MRNIYKHIHMSFLYIWHCPTHHIRHCTKSYISFLQMFWKDGLSKKKLAWNMIFFLLSEKMMFLFPDNMILFFRRKGKMIFLKERHRNIIFSASVLKRWSFQKLTGIWFFFNYQQRWYFYFLEIWSYYLSLYFKLIYSNLLILLQIMFSPNQICTGMSSSKLLVIL